MKTEMDSSDKTQQRSAPTKQSHVHNVNSFYSNSFKKMEEYSCYPTMMVTENCTPKTANGDRGLAIDCCMSLCVCCCSSPLAIPGLAVSCLLAIPMGILYPLVYGGARIADDCFEVQKEMSNSEKPTSPTMGS